MNYISLAIGLIFVLLGAFYFARGDRDSAKGFFLIGLLAAIVSIIRLIITTRKTT